MKILSIGTDRKLFEKESAVLTRQKEYAGKMEEMHIIVFSLKKLGLKEFREGNLHIYPTNSFYRLKYISDAMKIAEKIVQKNGLNKGDFVISTQDPFECGLVGKKLKKIFNIPLQIQIHTDFLDPHFKNSFLNRIRVLISKFTIPKADGIRVVSSVIANSLKKEFPNLRTNIDVLPLFVDVEKFFRMEEQFYTPEKLSSVVMTSRFTKEKRIDIGLEVFKKVVDQKKDAMMLLIGSGSEKGNIDKKITELNLQDNIKVLEWEKDVIQAYRKSKIFLFTSEYEGYGMTLIEAGAAGCPIVTTKVGIAKTDLFKSGENSFVCEVGDVDCLATSIIDLLENPEKRKSFSNNMRDSIKNISISKDQYMMAYVGLLQKILHK